jgi:hypothetical protein
MELPGSGLWSTFVMRGGIEIRHKVVGRLSLRVRVVASVGLGTKAEVIFDEAFCHIYLKRDLFSGRRRPSLTH